MITATPFLTRIRHAWAVLLGRAHVIEIAAENDIALLSQSFRSNLMALVDEFNNYVAEKNAADAANVTALAAANAQIATLEADATATSTAIANAQAALTPAPAEAPAPEAAA